MGKYGSITYIDSEGLAKETDIVHLMQSTFKNNRVVSVAETELGTYILSVENPKSTGRCVQSVMHLTEESLVSLLTTVHLFLDKKGYLLEEKIGGIIDNDLIKYRSSFDEEKEENDTGTEEKIENK